MVDPGAFDNLTGDAWVKRSAEIAAAFGRKVIDIRRGSPRGGH